MRWRGRRGSTYIGGLPQASPCQYGQPMMNPYMRMNPYMMQMYRGYGPMGPGGPGRMPYPPMPYGQMPGGIGIAEQHVRDSIAALASGIPCLDNGGHMVSGPGDIEGASIHQHQHHSR